MTCEWELKYKPISLKEFIGHNTEKQIIINWIETFDTVSTKTLILLGNHGIGKTLFIELLAKEYNYKITRINLSNSKNIKISFNTINGLLDTNNIKVNTDETQKNLLLIDNADYITKNPNLNIIKELVTNNNKKSLFPIIFITNGHHNKFIDNLSDYALKIKFKNPSSKDMLTLVNVICSGEKVTVPDDIKSKIIDFAQNDYRRLNNILNDIFINLKKHTNLNGSKDCLTLDIFKKYIQISKQKDIYVDLFESTKYLLFNYSSINHIISLYSYEKVKLPLMIHENYIGTLFNKATNNTQRLLSIQRISDYISKSDIIETNIYLDQTWGLRDIHGFFSCVKPSYELSKFKNINTYQKIEFGSDLHKNSTKNINKNTLEEFKKLFPDKSLDELLFMSKYIYDIIQETKYEKLKSIMETYKLSYKHIESFLKLDKTKKISFTFTSKIKKMINL